jgi:serine/threonine-protein kinase SRPK3
MRKPFQDCIRGCGFPFSDEEIEHAATFMHRCLRLDPKDRATARDLLEDPWLLS